MFVRRHNLVLKFKKLSPGEPITDLRHIPVVENGEPLVDVLAHCPKLLLDRPRFKYRRENVVRLGVADRLKTATESLPPSYRIALIEGWRAPLIQRRMYLAVWRRTAELHPEWSEPQLKRVVNRWTAPLDPKVPPPHTTGAAIDVVLTDPEGEPYDLTGPFETVNSKMFPSHSAGLSPEAQQNRKILREALENAGITNYPSEYWHYSYGDQGWAYRGSHPNAIYGQVQPPGWKPAPVDDTDQPLTFLSDPPQT